MTILHSKSPCCQEIIYRYGGKRRACSRCGKTWRIRPKRRGRKPIRRSGSLIHEILGRGTTLTAWANRRNLTVATASEQLHRALNKFVNKSADPAIPDSSAYALLVDGLWFYLEKQN